MKREANLHPPSVSLTYGRDLKFNKSRGFDLKIKLQRTLYYFIIIITAEEFKLITIQFNRILLSITCTLLSLPRNLSPLPPSRVIEVVLFTLIQDATTKWKSISSGIKPQLPCPDARSSSRACSLKQARHVVSVSTCSLLGEPQTLFNFSHPQSFYSTGFFPFISWTTLRSFASIVMISVRFLIEIWSNFIRSSNKVLFCYNILI